MGEEKFGYAVAEYFKNGNFKCFWCVDHDYDKGERKVQGVYGSGDMYYYKTECKKDVQELNKVWGYKAFKCVQVRMHVLGRIGGEDEK